jgi:hypothetical protein
MSKVPSTVAVHSPNRLKAAIGWFVSLAGYLLTFAWLYCAMDASQILLDLWQWGQISESVLRKLGTVTISPGMLETFARKASDGKILFQVHFWWVLISSTIVLGLCSYLIRLGIRISKQSVRPRHAIARPKG